MIEATLGTWTALRTRSLLLVPMGLSLFAIRAWSELWLSGEDPLWLWILLGIGIGGWLYWLLLGVINRWTLRASPEGVEAWYGPLPWIWWHRSFSIHDVHALLPAESITDVSGSRYAAMVLVSSYGLDVMHPDGACSALVRGCGDSAQVSQVKQRLERVLGVGLGGR